ncbi:hypothetical protein PF0434 [Pyrococcus furiosus DSM 3638]|uniref:Uncharacterized protein n=1 Tax=Pyrococcus furiosus (strain ATCC 43587 / DSM 3638 / JCM 8422 / Vc1) TaxID=186497 RepID=Q8U3M3_PYRFU|nr:hypothetical protein PF0434 [Pyrococcus furiosus DSM 3638]
MYFYVPLPPNLGKVTKIAKPSATITIFLTNSEPGNIRSTKILAKIKAINLKIPNEDFVFDLSKNLHNSSLFLNLFIIMNFKDITPVFGNPYKSSSSILTDKSSAFITAIDLY